LKTPPLKSFETIFEQEVSHAERELERPSRGLFVSGLIAGFGIGVSVLLVAMVASFPEAAISAPMRTLLIANAYSVGFILVILGSTDLFTEYTTIAILPVLTGASSVARLGRLWGIVLGANLIGGTVFSILIVSVAPRLGVVDGAAFENLAVGMMDHEWWVMLLSATLTGWLMGFMSWLLIAARETISQIFFVWIIGATIGGAHLHHSIVGTIEVVAGLLMTDQIGVLNLARFFLWVTLGNIVGSVCFAVSIRYGSLISGSGKGLRE
jgi:formate-nitrite transporter family protein